MERIPPTSYSYPEGYRVDKKDWHFCQRLLKRYGLILLNGELTQLQNKVLKGDTKFRGIKGRAYAYDMHSVELERVLESGQNTYSLLVSVNQQTGQLISALPVGKKKNGVNSRARIRSKARDGVHETRERSDRRFFLDSVSDE